MEATAVVAPSWFMMIIMFVLGGGGGELLDLVPADAYWQAKGVTVSAESMLAELKPGPVTDAAEWVGKLGNASVAVREEATAKLQAMGPAVLPELREAAKSDDAEVAARATMLIEKLTGGGPREAEIRKLMAIRTLGDLKAKDALPALKEQADSKEPFVAEYARRALAAIEGRVHVRAGPSAEDMQKDLWLLPANCGLVAQATPPAAVPKLDDVLEMMPPGMPAEQRAQAKQEITRAILQIAEKAGNFRLDGITLGVADNVGQNKGFVVMIARGLYDPNAVAELVRPVRTDRNENIGGIEVLRPDRNVGILLPSSDRLVFVAGPAREEPLPLEAMAKAVKAGKGALADNAEMVKLIKSVDASRPLWAVARIGETYSQVPFLSPFDTITCQMDHKDGVAEISVQARGHDADAVKQCVADLQAKLDEARREAKEAIEQMPAMRPLGELLDSIKLTADGTTATGTARMKEPAKSFMGVIMGVFSERVGKARERAARARVGAGVPPPKPQPVAAE